MNVQPRHSRTELAPNSISGENPTSASSPTGITAVVLTRNVAAIVDACLTPLAWVDSILIVDDFSTDETHAVCQRHGARVLERKLESFAAQRNFALQHVETPWVLFIDSDEILTPELAAEIRTAVRDGTAAGYWIPRKNLLKERWLRYAGWSPDYQLRLFQVAQGRYDPTRLVHELVVLDGPEERLTEPLTHYSYASVRQFVAKHQRYAQLEARRLWLQGQRVRPHNYILQPLRAFNRHFFTWRGYTGGWVGFALSAAMAYFDWRTHRHLAALEKDPTTQVWQEFRDLPAATCGVSVVIVSYNVLELLTTTINSVVTAMEQAEIAGEVIVVDNASQDAGAARVRDRFPKVRLIANEANMGFGKAANQGMLAARGELVVVLKPSVEVQSGFFGAILEYLAAQPHVGVVGPHVRQPDGVPQSTCRRSHTWATTFLESTPLQWWLGETSALQRFYCSDLDETQPARVDWVVGACLVVRRSALQAVGGFDPRFFMYFAEPDWCQRINEAGWQVAYFPGAHVLHHRSHSAGQDLIARALDFHNSRQEFLAKERGRLAALPLRGIIGFLFVVYTAEQALRGLLKARDPHLLQKANVCAHVAVWYLTGFPGRGRRLV